MASESENVNIELKPCPFCGGEAVFDVRNNGGFADWIVQCKNRKTTCLVNMRTHHGEKTRVAQEWNTRHESERIERLEAALRNLVEAVEQSAKDSLYLFQLGLQHGMSYRGRQYGEELEAAKAALEGK